MDTLRDHGQAKKYFHSMVGWNGRMDGIQAAALRIKLRHLAQYNAARRQKAQEYQKALAGIPDLVLPLTAPGRTHVFHIYAVRTKQRDELLGALGKNGVHCGIHYPVPIHLQAAYKELGLRRGAFPVAEQCADEFLSLPMYPELTSDQVQYVVSQVESFFSRAATIA
jgi:dTDP-4-amino-4,6-dideoxygalactose transaminase